MRCSRCRRTWWRRWGGRPVDPAVSLWQVWLPILLPWVRRLFILFLILFTLAVVSNIFANQQTPSTWLYWKPFEGALGFCIAIITLVQILAIAVIVFANYHRMDEGSGHLMSKRAMKRNAMSILLFLHLEWTVISITTLMISLTTLDEHAFGFNFPVAFTVTFLSSLIQYCIYVYRYRRRRAPYLWTWRDCFMVVSPITAMLLGAAVIFIVKLITYPFNNSLQTYLAATIVTGVFMLLVPPFLLYHCYIKRLRRQHNQATLTLLRSFEEQRQINVQDMFALSSLNRRDIRFMGHLEGRSSIHGTPLTAAQASFTQQYQLVAGKVLARSRELGVDRRELNSLMLVGLNISRLDGLTGCVGLKRLYVSNNELKSFDELPELVPELELLNIDDNLVDSFVALVPLRRLSDLHRLTFERNPLCNDAAFEFGKVICLLPQISHLNGLPVTAETRDAARQQNSDWLKRLLAEDRKYRFLKVIGRDQLEDTQPQLHALSPVERAETFICWRSQMMSGWSILHPGERMGDSAVKHVSSADREFFHSISNITQTKKHDDRVSVENNIKLHNSLMMRNSGRRNDNHQHSCCGITLHRRCDCYARTSNVEDLLPAVSIHNHSASRSMFVSAVLATLLLVEGDDGAPEESDLEDGQLEVQHSQGTVELDSMENSQTPLVNFSSAVSVPVLVDLEEEEDQGEDADAWNEADEDDLDVRVRESIV